MNIGKVRSSIKMIRSYDFKSDNIFKTVVAVLFYIVVAFFGAFLTDTDSEWYRGLNLPNIQPKPYVFGYVWTFIYLLLIVITALLIWNGDLSQKLRNQVVINGVLNAVWTYAFFNQQNPVGAFVILFSLIILNYNIYIEITSSNKILGYLYIIYLAWLVFAIFLNYAILFIN